MVMSELYNEIKNAICNHDESLCLSVEANDIINHIRIADLFLLCWSISASKSDYVNKEKNMAIERAYPQVVSGNMIKIYPISIEPQADLPDDMINTYNFEKIK